MLRYVDWFAELGSLLYFKVEFHFLELVNYYKISTKDERITIDNKWLVRVSMNNNGFVYGWDVEWNLGCWLLFSTSAESSCVSSMFYMFN